MTTHSNLPNNVAAAGKQRSSQFPYAVTARQASGFPGAWDGHPHIRSE